MKSTDWIAVLILNIYMLVLFYLVVVSGHIFYKGYFDVKDENGVACCVWIQEEDGKYYCLRKEDACNE